MPFQIVNESIIEIKTDAIVNSSNEFLKGLGGTDKLIHEQAGPLLDAECTKIGGIGLGEAVITSSFEMNNCQYIIHTAGPAYIDGKHKEKQILYKCYKNCLKLAKENGLESVAFPLISSGTYQFPRGQALEVASKAIVSFLEDYEMDVYLLVYDKAAFDTSKRIFRDIDRLLNPEPVVQQQYIIPQGSVKLHSSVIQPRKQKKQSSVDSYKKEEIPSDDCLMYEPVLCEYAVSASENQDVSFKPDVKFSDYLISIIDKRNYKDSDVYKKSNISKSLFNDIKNDRHKPKKETLCALCFGMKLSLDESLELLDRAGYTLSEYLTFDKIIRYFLKKKYYDIFEINQVLYENDCITLGSKSH